MTLHRAALAVVPWVCLVVLLAGDLGCGGGDDDDDGPSKGNDEDAATAEAAPPEDDAGDSPGGMAGAGSGAGNGDASTWPMMGYDERNWYFNANEKKLSVDNAASVLEKWRFKTGGFPPGTAVVGEGKVFVMATVGTYALDLETGAEVWRRMDLAGTASVAWEEGFVYVHNYTPPSLYKLNSADGTTVWGPVVTNELSGCTGGSSPILGGGKVIVGRECGPLEIGFGAAGAKGGVVAVNTDGTPGWTYITPAEAEDGAMVWSSVGIDVDGGVVFAATGNNYTMAGENSDSIHAIDLASGMKNWAQQVRTGDTWSLFTAPRGPDTDFGANPVIAEIGGKPIVAAGDKGSAFWALNREDGTIEWMREQLSVARDQAHGGFLMNSSFDGSTFYGLVNDTSSRSANLVALAAAGGADKWAPKNYPGVFAWAAPSIANGVLVAPVDSNVYLIDAATGADLKTIETAGTIAAGAVSIADGHLIISSGLMYQLDATAKPNDEIICYGLP